MKQFKQKTVNGTTLRNGMGKTIEENAGRTKQEGMKEFRATVDIYKQHQSSNSNNGGFLGEPLL